MDTFIQWQIYGMLAYLLSLESDEYNHSLSLMMDNGAVFSNTVFAFRQGYRAMRDLEELACGEWIEVTSLGELTTREESKFAVIRIGSIPLDGSEEPI